MTSESSDISAQLVLLNQIRRVQQCFIEDARPQEVYGSMLDALMELTGSSMGMLGTVEPVPRAQGGAVGGAPAPGGLQGRVLACGHPRGPHGRVARASVEARRGMALPADDPILAAILASADPFPADSLESAMDGAGFHGIDTFLGIPIRSDGVLVGFAVVGNSAAGYSDGTVEYLEPLVVTIASLFRMARYQEERWAAEQALRDAKRAADEANVTKTEFLANMSHELRTPMTAILGFTDLLEDESISVEERKGAVATIRRNGDYLLQLLEDVLDLSKVEAGQMRIDRTACSPGRLAQEVVQLLAPRAHGKGIQFRLVATGDVPAVVSMDPVRYRQVLVNLVGNAIKFTESGEVVVEMELPRGHRTELVVVVRDTGIGIAQNHLDAIFQPFHQADSGMTRRAGGTGLGLSISHRLALLMGGGISVTSRLGEGSTFRLTIDPGPMEGVPCLSRDQLAAQDDQARAAQAKPATPTVGGRVLLVEDGPDNQRLIARIVRKAGAEVTIAENGQVGVEVVTAAQAAGEPFDLILMDMQMPVLDGYDATRKQRGDGVVTPIVALTAHAMAGDRERCIRAGCSDYTTKPVKMQDLLAILSRELPQAATARPS